MSPTDERANARNKVGRAVRNGRPLSAFALADLDYAFAGHEDELDELRALAENVAAERAENNHRALQSQKLRAATDAVLAEWDARDRAERRRLAEAEARKRLDEEDA